MLLLFVIGISQVSAQDNVRVKCRQFTMNVTSDNVKCYQTLENSSLPIDASDEDVANAQVANTALYFTDFENIKSPIAPQVTFYLVDDLGKTSFTFLNAVMNLTDITNNLNSGYMTSDSIDIEIPFLPYQTAARTVSVLPQKVDFNGGSGIRTIVSFSDQISANASSSNLYYSWQGINERGNYYISAVFPLRSTVLDGKSAGDVDWGTYDGQELQPSLNRLDFYIRSIVIE